MSWGKPWFYETYLLFQCLTGANGPIELFTVVCINMVLRFNKSDPPLLAVTVSSLSQNIFLKGSLEQHKTLKLQKQWWQNLPTQWSVYTEPLYLIVNKEMPVYLHLLQIWKVKKLFRNFVNIVFYQISTKKKDEILQVPCSSSCLEHQKHRPWKLSWSHLKPVISFTSTHRAEQTPGD